jgi:hypothetical protein
METKGTKMENIADLVATIYDETGITVQLEWYHSAGTWIAKITEDGHALLDRNGEFHLIAGGDTLAEALEDLDDRCAVGRG